MGAFDKILARLNRVWNKDPQRVEIATLSKAGAMFRVANLKLYVTSGGAVSSVPLDGTVNDLLAALQALGFTTILSQVQYGPLLSRGLIEQETTESGGSIAYHQSILWSELRTCSWELDDQRARIDDATRQIYMHAADGTWADLWGDIFGVYRAAGEADRQYIERIVAEAIRPRGNNVSLENILFEAFGLECRIRDAVPNISELPPEEQGQAVGRFLLDLSVPNNLSPEEATVLIERMKTVVRSNKATGTDFMQTVLQKMVQFEEKAALSETVALTITAALEEPLPSGPIYCGTGWVCGIPGLLCGTNDALKEQIIVKTILAADDSVVAQGLYGG